MIARCFVPGVSLLVVALTSVVPAGAQAPPVPPASGSGSDVRAAVVVARVDGTPITDLDLEDHLARSRGDAWRRLAPEPLLEAKRDALEQHIRVVVVENELARRKIQVSPEEVRAQVAALTEQLKARNQRIEDVLLAGNSNLWFLERVMRNTVGLYKAIDAEVKDEAVKAFFETNPKMFLPEVAVRHIVVLTVDLKTGMPLDQERQDLAKEKVLQCAKELAPDGGNFMALMAKYSEGTKADQGGTVQKMTPASRVDKALLDACFALAKGEVSRIVRSKFGYHLIQCVDKVEPTWQDARQPCVQAIQEVVMSKLLEEAKVERLDPTLVQAVIPREGRK